MPKFLMRYDVLMSFQFKQNESFGLNLFQVWIEYVEHKKNPLKETFGHVDNNELPAPISDISRILIERLRIPGSKYFGIDTAEVCYFSHFRCKTTNTQNDLFFRLPSNQTPTMKLICANRRL